MRQHVWFYLVVGLAVWNPHANAATVAEIDNSVKRGVAALYAMQKPNGHWEGVEAPEEGMTSVDGGQWTGTTAFVAYALLEAGENANDPRLVKAIDFIRKNEAKGVYALATRCLMYSSIPSTPERDRALRGDTQKLVRAMRVKFPARGLFGYDATPSDTETGYDHSLSQLAILGLQAASDQGMPVPENLWVEADAAFRRNQQPEGGWCYNPQGRKDRETTATISMTTAAVATLYNTQIHLIGTNTNCRGNLTDPNVDRGLKWIEQHFDDTFDIEKQNGRIDFRTYTLFNLQRAAAASGYSRIGAIDWFQRGGDWLIKSQERGGTWRAFPTREAGTAESLLFLVHGRAPLAFNKLQYSIPDKSGSDQVKLGNWNQRPRDVANLSRWVGRQFERKLNWQIVNLEIPTARLLEAPVMILSGDQTIDLTDKDAERLRDYIERGGLVIGNADCGNELFKTSFRKLGQKLFPAYEFRILPSEHPIFNSQIFQAKNWKVKQSVQALSNGARELMILLPGDFSAEWQKESAATRKDAFEMMANVFLSSSEKSDLITRGNSSMVEDDPAIQTTRVIRVARLKYAGNFDPEPGSWKQFAAVIKRDEKAQIEAALVPLGEDQLKDFKFAHLTGTTKFEFSDKQRQEIKSFIDAGGTLLVDACGGSGDFATSAEDELRKLFPEQSKELETPLPPDHALYQLPKKAKIDVKYRQATLQRLGNLKDPRIRGLTINKRVAVYYSAEDLSVGLVGHRGDSIHGYTPATATAIVRNIVRN